MSKWVRKAADFVIAEDGPTATEYAILLSLIIVVAMAAIRAFGVNLNATFAMVSNTLFG